MTLIFAVSDSWGLFTQNIFPGKNRMKNCTLGGSPKWDRQIWKKYFFHFEKQYLLIFKRLRWFFFVFKNIDLKYFRLDKNIYVEICLPPITATSKRPWFWRFFAFSRKTREIFENYFLIYHRTWLEQFFPVLFRGVTYNVLLEKLKKIPKNANFLTIHQI